MCEVIVDLWDCCCGAFLYNVVYFCSLSLSLSFSELMRKYYFDCTILSLANCKHFCHYIFECAYIRLYNGPR